jgi:magnesium transporter
MITIHCWNKATRAVESLAPDALAARRQELLAGENILWIDLTDPSPEEEALVFQQFCPVHFLTLEDVTKPRREPGAIPHLPKVEEFPDYLFVIVNPLTDEYLQVRQKGLTTRWTDRDGIFTQLSAVLTRTLLLTHHYQPLASVQQLQAFLTRHAAQTDRGPDYLFHLILDGTVDQFAPVLDRLDDTLDSLETRVVHNPSSSLLLILQRLKREIIRLRKILIYEREVLVRLARGEFELVDERETVYYRNVYDHLVRFTELIESSRELVGDLVQNHLAAVSNRLNAIMKVLTMISTTVLPMTLIAGVYGMNFKRFPELDWPWGYPFALGLMLVTGLAALAGFKWAKWF